MGPLADIAYRYYPRLGDALYRLEPQAYDELYQSSPEYQALLAAQREALADIARWRAVVAAIGAAVPRGAVRDATRGYHDVCYTARVHLGAQPSPDDDGDDDGDDDDDGDGPVHTEVVVLASFLAPVYAVYESVGRERDTPDGPGYEPVRASLDPSPELAPVVAVIDEQIARALGYARLDPRVAATVIPDVQVGNLEPGQATILDALFTDDRW